MTGKRYIQLPTTEQGRFVPPTIKARRTDEEALTALIELLNETELDDDIDEALRDFGYDPDALGARMQKCADEAFRAFVEVGNKKRNVMAAYIEEFERVTGKLRKVVQWFSR